MDDERFSKAVFGVFAVGFLFLAFSVFLVVWESTAQVLVWWVLAVLQIFLTLTLLCATAFAVWHTFSGLTRRIEKFEREHAKLLAQLKRRAPAALATTVVAGQIILLLADKSFDGAPIPTLVVSVILTIFSG